MRLAVAGLLSVVIACAPSTSSTSTSSACGDGALASGEACDDGNAQSGDGCSAACALESGFTCGGTPTQCTPVCGDGLVVGSEACDPGMAPSQGCSAACEVRAGFHCTGSPSTCTTQCGDGVVTRGEACDDGNAQAGDGCSAECVVEPGSMCHGNPSRCEPFCQSLTGALYTTVRPEAPVAPGTVITMECTDPPLSSRVRWFASDGVVIHEVAEGTHVEFPVEASPTIVGFAAFDSARGCFKTEFVTEGIGVQQPDHAAGLPAPALSAPDVDGAMFTLESLHGQYVMLDFCAGYCASCVEYVAPAVEPIRQALAQANVQLTWVQALVYDGTARLSGQDDAADWRDRFRVDDGVVLHTADGTDRTIEDAFNQYGLAFFPGFVFIDPNGVIIRVEQARIDAQEIADIFAEYAGVTAGRVGEILPISDAVRSARATIRTAGEQVSEELRLNDRGVVRINGLGPAATWTPFAQIVPVYDRDRQRESWTIELSYNAWPAADAEITMAFDRLRWMDGRIRRPAPEGGMATVSLKYDGPTPGTVSLGAVMLSVVADRVSVPPFSMAGATLPEGATPERFIFQADDLLMPAP